MKKEFAPIITIIKQARQNAYTAVNIELINCYWQVSEFISSRVSKASWGDKTEQPLADYSQNEYADTKGNNRLGLYRMKRFYETYYSSGGRMLQKLGVKNSTGLVRENVQSNLM